ncbi:hypothetical protein RYX36_029468 [Vicia faba]
MGNELTLVQSNTYAKKLKRSAHPDEIFIATHKKKNVEWFNPRAEQHIELKRNEREDDIREWFNTFKDRYDNAKMENLFHQKCDKRLSDILQKTLKNSSDLHIRMRSSFPPIKRRMGNGLTLVQSNTYAKKLKRSAHSDEIFIATHKKKNGEWFNPRAEQHIELKRDEREDDIREWFNTFKDRYDNAKMENLFHQKCGKRLSDILQKVRKKVHMPPWMGVDTWAFLLDKWK